MKKTDMTVCVRDNKGYGVCRVVYKNGEHYYVKVDNKLVNVDEKIKRK